MEVFGFAALFGLVLGFMFGVGCAAAVIYTVYMGGYRRSIEDSLREVVPVRYSEMLGKIRSKMKRTIHE
jgi:hypothetical protein